MRQKHRNDHNHGKNGWVGGNPRYGKKRGFRRGDRARHRQAVQRQTRGQ